jgi:hypothetical protein
MYVDETQEQGSQPSNYLTTSNTVHTEAWIVAHKVK